MTHRSPARRRPANRRRPTREAGFTLLEVVVTVAVLMIGLMAMSSTSVVVDSLRKSSGDRATAQAAMQYIIADLRATAHAADDDPANWADEVLAAFGPGGVPGEQIDVEGLQPWAGQPSVATVQIVTDETTTDAALGVAAGMPRDLEGDGAATDVDVRGSAALLPAIVRIRWTGEKGDQQLTEVVYLLRY